MLYVKTLFTLLGILFISSTLVPPIASGKDEGYLQRFEASQHRAELHIDEWRVRPENFDIEADLYKHQPRSTTDFKNTSTMQLLDFYHWKDQRLARDKMPDWKLRLSDSRHSETFAHFIQCVFRCEVYREINGINAQYMSRVLEGDEVRNDEDSYAWLMMPDGSLMRISPKTSVSLNEVNIARDKTLYILRLNYGHIHWQQRQLGQFKVQDMAQTDQVFLPLMIPEANREYYMRKEYQELSDSERMVYVLGKNIGHKSQYKKINDYLSQSKENFENHHTEVVVFTANATIRALNATFDLWYDIKGSAYIRKMTEVNGLEVDDKRESSIEVSYRGHENRDKAIIDENQWMEMIPDGKTLIQNQSIGDQFKLLELLVQRIPSIHLAREIMLRKYYDFNFWQQDKLTNNAIASNFNYRLWDYSAKDELQNRVEFVIESTRLLETTSLKSQDKLFKNKKPLYFDKSYTQYAYDKYLEFLKVGRSGVYSEVKLMTESQYYVWMLRYARKNLSTNSR